MRLPIGSRTRIPRRYHRIDGWRGYSIPGTAIAGASDTGSWAASPCPSDKVKAEIQFFQREVLRPAGIKSRQRFGSSSNVFCGKRWLCVVAGDWPKAARIAQEWISANDHSLRYLHTADQQAALQEVQS